MSNMKRRPSTIRRYSRRKHPKKRDLPIELTVVFTIDFFTSELVNNSWSEVTENKKYSLSFWCDLLGDLEQSAPEVDIALFLEKKGIRQSEFLWIDPDWDQHLPKCIVTEIQCILLSYVGK
ncbi:MAG: hypothetical protein ACE5OZ_13165 [Candidatus Heimdallarchaeota archaeon]